MTDLESTSFEASTAQSAAPTGMMALVFTDVQGSTTLWERQPDSMRTALLLHDSVLRQSLAEAGGYEVKTEGDAFMVSFSTCLNAVHWCLQVQERLLEVAWPADILNFDDAREERGKDGEVLWRGLRVRMGLHVGEPECRPDPLTGRMDYYGPMVNRSARVAGGAHGGQIIVSGWAWQLMQPGLAQLSVVPVDLGEHRLRGIDSSERLVQVLPAALQGRSFPPPRTVEARKSNLATPATPYVGRTTELRTLMDEFSLGARCMTLTGPGGIGKTRLALRAAALLLDEHCRHGGGGVWFCDLTEARTLEAVCQELANVLNVPLVTGQSPDSVATVLGHALAARGRMLLVLDNLEQVAERARPALNQWLQAAPTVRMLITSRDRLGIAGERLHEIGPMSLPSASQEPSDAVELFVERVRAVRPGYKVEDADRQAVEAIVRTLDGIPLAIELAAARMRMFQPAQLLDRLRRSFDFLGSGPLGVGSKSGTLRSTIEWSWNLLDSSEKQGLVDCSAFCGGFTLEAAEAVMTVPDAFEVLSSLRDRSLIRTHEAVDGAGELRFGLYETIRQFAAAELGAGGTAHDVRHRHAAFYAGLCRARIELPDARRRQLRAWQQLVPEVDNLKAAIQHSIDDPGPQAAENTLELALGLAAVMSKSGPLAPMVEYLDAAIAKGSENARLLAEAYSERGKARWALGERQASLADFGLGLAAARTVGDRRLECAIQANLGAQLMLESRREEAKAVFEAALAVAVESGNTLGEALASDLTAWYYSEKGEFASAETWSNRAIELARAAGDTAVEARATGVLANLALERGRPEEALALVRRAARLHETCGDTRTAAIATLYMGCYQEALGQSSEAYGSYLRASAALRAAGDVVTPVVIPALLGGLEAQAGNIAEAERLLGLAESVAPHTVGRFTTIGIDLRRGHLDLARARQATAVGDLATASALRGEALARIERAMTPTARSDQPGSSSQSPASQSDDVRLHILLLRRDLERG